jgi:hypothetical protein
LAIEGTAVEELDLRGIAGDALDLSIADSAGLTRLRLPAELGAQSMVLIHVPNLVDLEGSLSEVADSVTLVDTGLVAYALSGGSAWNAVQIENNPALETLDLSGMASVQRLTVRNHPSLSSFIAPDLTEADTLLITVETSLSLSALDTIDTLHIEAILPDVHVDISRVTLADNLEVSSAAAGASLDASSLAEAGNANISNTLGAHVDLGSLATAGYLTLENVDSIDLPSLTAVSWARLRGTLPSSMAFSEYLETEGFYVTDTHGLQELSFNGLLADFMEIMNNADLVQVGSTSFLTPYASLTISGNPKLETLSVSELLQVWGTVLIDDNASLTSVTASPFAFDCAAVQITNNPSLRQCVVDTMIAPTTCGDASTPGDATISANGPSC